MDSGNVRYRHGFVIPAQRRLRWGGGQPECKPVRPRLAGPRNVLFQAGDAWGVFRLEKAGQVGIGRWCDIYIGVFMIIDDGFKT